MAYTMTVVEIDSGAEHVLPADAVTHDTPRYSRLHHTAGDMRRPAASLQRERGPLVPLGFRPRHDVFYIAAPRWPELVGKALRVKS
jgi:hypothetical protein